MVYRSKELTCIDLYEGHDCHDVNLMEINDPVTLSRASVFGEHEHTHHVEYKAHGSGRFPSGNYNGILFPEAVQTNRTEHVMYATLHLQEV